jgi:UrcA family protein
MTLTVHPAAIRLNRAAALALLGLLAAGQTGAAQETRTGPDSYALTVPHLDIHPRTLAEARRTLRRLGQAALGVCGASDESPPEVRISVRQSACWRQAMADALRRIDDPFLTQAYGGQGRTQALAQESQR